MKIWPIIILGLGVAGTGARYQERKDLSAQQGETKVEVTAVARDLDQPWELVWGPDRHIWFTEHAGKISRLNPETGKKEVLISIKDVLRLTTPGLMGLALHPDFRKNPYVFTDYTFRRDSTHNGLRLVRYTYRNGGLHDPKVLLEMPASRGHSGSRLVISPDRKLMFATGDAAVLTNAQSLSSLAGKVLRLNLDGSVPADNPIKGSYVWSWGHRNPQGLVYGKNGLLYSAEHGDAVEDELNLIEPLQNYGWPKVEGFCDQPKEAAFCDSVKITPPIKAWTPVIAPAGIDYYAADAIPEWKHSILLVTLKDADLRVLKLDPSGKKITGETIYFDKQYGRLRDLCISPEGDVYLSTSNRDWNPGPGFPVDGDDRIIRVRKKKTGVLLASLSGMATSPVSLNDPAGKKLYVQYCASCHKEDGKGIEGVFPALSGSPVVTGAKARLVQVLLQGISEDSETFKKAYDQPMPSFGFLPDSEIADIGTYIRTGLGNEKDRILVRDIVPLRQDMKK